MVSTSARVLGRSSSRDVWRVMPWDVWSYDPLIHLMLFVHRIEGLTPGLYFLVRHPGKLRLIQESMDRTRSTRSGPAAGKAFAAQRPEQIPTIEKNRDGWLPDFRARGLSALRLLMLNSSSVSESEMSRRGLRNPSSVLRRRILACPVKNESAQARVLGGRSKPCSLTSRLARGGVSPVGVIVIAGVRFETAVGTEYPSRTGLSV